MQSPSRVVQTLSVNGESERRKDGGGWRGQGAGGRKKRKETNDKYVFIESVNIPCG